MAQQSSNREPSDRKIIASNRKARHDYAVVESFEAGVVLMGTEVKALRLGRANIAESYAAAEGGAIVLVNAHIPEYGPWSTGRRNCTR